MAETKTLNYQWTKPEVTKSPSTWGQTLNDDLDGIDGQIFANQTNVAAIQGQLSPQNLTIFRTASLAGSMWYSNSAAAAGQQGRWLWYLDPSPEGGNAGSNLTLYAYSDTQAQLGYALSINRAAQTVSVAKDPTVALGVATKQYVDKGSSPIGTIIMWGGPSASIPPGWVQCWGQKYNYAQYPALFNVIGGNYGWDGTNFSVPALQGRMPLGWDAGVSPNGYYLGLQGGEYSHQLSVAELPGHTHPITDVSHNHGATQPAHNHGDFGHTHGVSASQDAHTHSYQHTSAGHAGLASGGSFAGEFTDTTSGASAANVYVSIATGYANLQAAQPGVTINASGTGLSTTQAAGSWAAHNNLPPYCVVLFLIRIV